mgnify:CR=1 FL=1
MGKCMAETKQKSKKEKKKKYTKNHTRKQNTRTEKHNKNKNTLHLLDHYPSQLIFRSTNKMSRINSSLFSLVIRNLETKSKLTILLMI